VDKFPPTAQRKALLKFQAALNSSPKCLVKDECSDWRINGSTGHVYAICGTITEPKTRGFMLYVMTGSARAWTFALRSLSFGSLEQDGDTEGAVFLDRLPTPEEATIIRRALGIRKRRTLSPEHVEKLQRGLLRGHLAAQGVPSKTPEVHP
jgi:hypothetical protein